MKNNLNDLNSNVKYTKTKNININYLIENYFKNINFWIMFVIGFGILIRFVQYLYNRSFFMDDAELALNVINRSYSQLLKPLDLDQGAPYGFLLIAKFCTVLFGNNEYAFRLFPFITGIASLILFYYLAKEYLSPFGVLVAISLFALIEPLYYYATAFKQYSSDVFFTILLLLLFTKLKSRGTSLSNLTLFSLIGAIIVWFSFPSVFVLASLGIFTGLYFLENRDLKSFLKIIPVCAVWLVSFIIYYMSSSLTTLSHSYFMLEFWDKAFMPIPSLTPKYFKWLINTFFDVFSFIMQYEGSALAGTFFILGLISFHKKNKTALYIFILPIIITLIVSCFHLYPFNTRLILFLIPCLLLFIAGGLELLKSATLTRKIVYIVPTALIIFYPLYYTGLNLHRPLERDEIKPVLSYISKNIQPQDEIYLYSKAIHPFDFYKSKFNLAKYHTIAGVYSKDDWKEYINNINQLRGKKRVWILFIHVNDVTVDKVLIQGYLDSFGTKLQSFLAVGAEAYLYDLSGKNPTIRHRVPVAQSVNQSDKLRKQDRKL